MADISAEIVVRALSASLSDRKVAVLHQGISGNYDYASALSPHWPQTTVVGLSDHDMLPVELAAQFVDARQLAIDTQHPQRLAFELRQGLRRHPFEAQFIYDCDDNGFAGTTIILT